MTRSVWVMGMQLSRRNSALPDDRSVPIVMIETKRKIEELPFHRKKIVLILSAMRHFAEELRADGYVVDYRRADDFVTGLREHLAEYGSSSLTVMEAEEWAWYEGIEDLVAGLGVPVTVTPNTLFLVPRTEFADWARGRRTLRMEQFYRRQRMRTGILMRPDGTPEGGVWNYDTENRLPPPRNAPPPPPRFVPDAITREVLEWAEHALEDHYGSLDGFSLPVTRAQALEALDDFIRHRLAVFGPYEDAMKEDAPYLAHSALSACMNIGLLHPQEAIEAAERAWNDGTAPIASVEGFIRQILGWREFINGVYWMRMPGYRAVNALGHRNPLPESYWDPSRTEMRCLRTAVQATIDEGYTHHIQRLMVLGNHALLCGVDPAEINRWFRIAYVDAYEWVVAPNVLGMSQHADGGYFASKPYIASGAYINRMSDSCGRCRYDVAKRTGPDACPLNSLYWNFLDAHRSRFATHHRMRMMYATWDRLPAAEQKAVRQSADAYLRSIGCRPLPGREGTGNGAM